MGSAISTEWINGELVELVDTSEVIASVSQTELETFISGLAPDIKAKLLRAAGSRATATKTPAELEVKVKDSTVVAPERPASIPALPLPALVEAPQFHDKLVLRRVLEAKHIQLILPQAFIHLFESGQCIPKYQDVPTEFILDVDNENLDWDRLEVIAVSYKWISRGHPDPFLYHLETLNHLCRLFMEGSFENAKERCDISKVDDPLLQRFQEEGHCFGSGDGRPVGIFLDWMSLPQEKRTSMETETYAEALRHINVWFAHAHTITWRLTSLPDAETRSESCPSYDESGWTTFERLLAGIVSRDTHLLLIDKKARKGLLQTAELDYFQVIMKYKDPERGAPVTPEVFNEMLADKFFSEETDRFNTVIPKYRQTFQAAIANAEELNYARLDFGDQAAREIIKFAQTYNRCESLDLSDNPKVKVPLYEFAMLKNLLKLDLFNSNVTGDIRGLQTLGQLTELNLGFTAVHGDIQVLESLPDLKQLILGGPWAQISGDIQVLKSLSNLSLLSLADTQVSGDVQVLKALKQLVEADLSGSQVSGDMQALEGLGIRSF